MTTHLSLFCTSNTTVTFCLFLVLHVKTSSCFYPVLCVSEVNKHAGLASGCLTYTVRLDLLLLALPQLLFLFSMFWKCFQASCRHMLFYVLLFSPDCAMHENSFFSCSHFGRLSYLNHILSFVVSMKTVRLVYPLHVIIVLSWCFVQNYLHFLIKIQTDPHLHLSLTSGY